MRIQMIEIASAVWINFKDQYIKINMTKEAKIMKCFKNKEKWNTDFTFEVNKAHNELKNIIDSFLSKINLNQLIITKFINV